MKEVGVLSFQISLKFHWRMLVVFLQLLLPPHPLPTKINDTNNTM